MNKQGFVNYVEAELLKKAKHNKVSMTKKANDFGIENPNTIKNLVELAIANVARQYAHQNNKSIEEKYNNIVELYYTQMNLAHRTSESILLQQYSTPAPIAFLMGVFCEIHTWDAFTDFRTQKRGFEPSAGNGLLTIAGNTNNFWVNEVDDTRLANLKTQGFRSVNNFDSSNEAFLESNGFKKYFDAIITNPPFGRIERKEIGGYKIQDLDHWMAILALNAMKDNGKAAIIIGGHTTWDNKGRITLGKNSFFFNYLYKNYNVVDVIQIDGKKLYTRMGTGFNTRLILIDGRKPKPEGYAPLFNPETDVIISSFEALYERILGTDVDAAEMEALALAIAIELETLKLKK